MGQWDGRMELVWVDPWARWCLVIQFSENLAGHVENVKVFNSSAKLVGKEDRLFI